MSNNETTQRSPQWAIDKAIQTLGFALSPASENAIKVLARAFEEVRAKERQRCYDIAIDVMSEAIEPYREIAHNTANEIAGKIKNNS